jgi:hypothetical protein
MLTVSLGCVCAAWWQGDYTDLAIEGQGKIKSTQKSLDFSLLFLYSVFNMRHLRDLSTLKALAFMGG